MASDIDWNDPEINEALELGMQSRKVYEYLILVHSTASMHERGFVVAYDLEMATDMVLDIVRNDRYAMANLPQFSVKEFGPITYVE